MQKLLIFGLIAVVILFMSSSGTVDACGSTHRCITDKCCKKSGQKCINHICEDVKCNPECLNDAVCIKSDSKDVCKCKAGYKFKQNSITDCEKDPQCRDLWFGINSCSRWFWNPFRKN
ncbi:hypothetical protein PV327_000461 [Microctonus hyperodae]|uniref:EGF-like domain-containing protein n=1 Tax=Microctonus hyperodae TaxID=165561 RepID=A0AA39G691_MICHY|nr:hypothetical protein PV327_000461 [Microctonus hyperodae]